MADQPDYRFECRIVDQNSDEVVIAGSSFVSSIGEFGQCESIDMEIGSLLRAFKRTARAEHECKNYQAAILEG
jgi:RNA polymerase-binding transcription factor DksA